MKKILLLTFIILPLLASCGGRGARKQAPPAELTIDIPKVPAMITDQVGARDFIVNHFWDNMDFADTAYIGKEITEQRLADYLNILLQTPPPQAVKGMDALLTKARADREVYNYFTEEAEHYLDDPNSPYRNEELFIAVLRNMIAWDALDEIYKLRPRSQLEMALKNRVGEKAADLVVTLSSGRKVRLYDQKADYTLLYFANPDCSACAQTTAELNASPIVRGLVESGELKVVTLYPDKELDLWRQHLGDLPGDWTNGYDAEQQVRDQELYDVRAIPSLYLLDKDKFVVLKDVPAGSLIHNYFQQALYR